MKKIIPNGSVLVPDNAKRVFKGQIFDVYQWPQKQFDGSDEIFEMLKRPDTVNVVAVVDNKILVIDDEQPHLGTRKSFPGGRVDDEDETTLAAAQREMLEETGHNFASWRLIKVTQPYRKIEWFVYTWLAWNATSQHETNLDRGEKIIVSQLDFSTLNELVMNDDDYLAKSRSLFKDLNEINELLALPEFTGQVINR